MASIDKFKEDRLAKLKKIREIGWNPYPSSYDKKNTVKESLESEGKMVKTAGKLYSLRTHGNIAFADLKDETGKIQLFFKRDVLGPEWYKNLNLLDMGDYLGVEGTVTKTVAGEISIVPTTYTLLGKAMLPLPHEWFGVKDIETRYRQRYLDLLMNPEVRERFNMRTKLVRYVRNYLDDLGFMEVETPVLQHLYGGANAKPFVTHLNALGCDMYLRIAVELYLKRLIAGGYEKVYEIAKNFRNEGVDHTHNPEFTMIEWYEAYANYHRVMDVTEGLFKYLAEKLFNETKMKVEDRVIDIGGKWPRIEMTEIIKKTIGVDVDKETTESLITYCKKEHIELIGGETKGQLIFTIFEHKVTDKLIDPTWIIDYPEDVSPLSKNHPTKKGWVERFEGYVGGKEICDGWSELTDPAIQRERFTNDSKAARKDKEEAQHIDEDYLTAMEYGMPPTGGIGVGIDRLTMFFTNTWAIKEVILFPTLKPEYQTIEEKNSPQEIRPSTLPLGRGHEFSIDPAVSQKFPEMKVGYAVIKGVSIKKQNIELNELKKTISTTIQSSLTLQDLDAIPSIKTYRNMFKAFGVDWQKRHPSADALLRRIIQGKGLYNINTLVDAYNVAVLDSKIALGAFDRNHLDFPTTLRFATEGEKIRLLGEDEDTLIHEGELIYADAKKNMTLDLNYRDCDSTKITEKTKDVVLYADGGPDISEKELIAGLEKGIEYITKFNGGVVTEKYIVVDSIATHLISSTFSKLTINREQALGLLNDKIKNKNLVKHCLAVEVAMKALAQKFEGDENKWGMAGLLHDGDWEITQNDHARHAVQVVEWIKELGENDPELLKTILVHNHHHNGENKPSTPMEWALYTCDELTGLIVATTLVMPTRKIQDVTVESVLKKFPAKSFAAGVNRDQIKMCETELNIPINEFVGIVLKSMQQISNDLGL